MSFRVCTSGWRTGIDGPRSQFLCGIAASSCFRAAGGVSSRVLVRHLSIERPIREDVRS